METSWNLRELMQEAILVVPWRNLSFFVRTQQTLLIWQNFLAKARPLAWAKRKRLHGQPSAVKSIVTWWCFSGARRGTPKYINVKKIAGVHPQTPLIFQTGLIRQAPQGAGHDACGPWNSISSDSIATRNRGSLQVLKEIVPFSYF